MDLEWTRRGPQDGTTHWSSRRLALALGTNHMTVSRVWARHGLQPHRLRRYMLSEDPDFEKKAADIIGLYLNPLDHAAVFCVDERLQSKPWTAWIRCCPFSRQSRGSRF